MVLDGRSTGGAENSIHKQSICLDLKERHGGAVSLVVCGNSTQVNEGPMQTPGITAGNFSGTSNGNIHVRAGKRQNDVTLEDIYKKQYSDDDEDDSDWEPLQKSIQILKWFCVNCTMANLDNVHHCDVCGEHRESGILKLGYLASPLFPEGVVNENGSRVLETKEAHYQNVASSNSTMVGFDERMLLHNEIAMKSHPHPERPDRLRAIAAGFATAGIFPGRCASIPAREITREELQRIHSSENIEAVELTSQMVASYFSPDTYANEHSALAARLAAGACADLASAIFTGRAKNGFALVRPPGHHAGVKQSSGFCLHNNAAVAASAAQLAGAKKVLIVDWDVHHGNGTQEIFDRSKSVLYVSLHRHEDGKFYPGTGAADNVGSMGAEGFCVNIPWSRRGVGDNDYIYAFQQVVIPIASEFGPDFTIISAGFDAARGDPLGCCDVTPDGFAQMTKMLSIFSGGKLLVILEGGYNLRSISSSATAVIKVLLGEDPACSSDKVFPSRSGLRTICAVLKIQMKFWHILEPIFSKLQSQWGDAFVGTVVSAAEAVRRKKVADLASRRAKESKLKQPVETQPAGQFSTAEETNRAPDRTLSPKAIPGQACSNPSVEDLLATGKMKHGMGKSPTKVAAQEKRKHESSGQGRTKVHAKSLKKSTSPLFSELMAKENEGKIFEVSHEPTQTNDTPTHIRGHHKLVANYWFGEEEGNYSFSKNIFWPDWHLRVNDSCSDPEIAKELNTKSILPRDRVAAHKLNDTDLHNNYMTYRALGNVYEMEFFQRQLAREAAHKHKYAAMGIVEKEWRDREAELTTDLKEVREALRQSSVENQEMSTFLAAMEKKVEELKRSENEKIQSAVKAAVQTAKAKAVKEYKAYDACKNDIVALSSLLYTEGYNDCALAGAILFSDLKVTKEALGYDPETKNFDDYLSKFQAGMDISDIWIPEDAADQGPNTQGTTQSSQETGQETGQSEP